LTGESGDLAAVCPGAPERRVFAGPFCQPVLPARDPDTCGQPPQIPFPRPWVSLVEVVEVENEISFRRGLLAARASLDGYGETVLVIGNPEGLQGTVSNGIISAFRESRSYIQITAPVSPGSSGSPVLDDTGQVIGRRVQEPVAEGWSVRPNPRN
jgi:hypothetical protein